MHPKIEYKEKIVTQVQERVKIRTIIKESPDGTKVTTIDSQTDKDTQVVTERQAKPSSKDYLISTTITYNASKLEDATYGIGVSKRFFLGLYGGFYANTNQDIGIMLSYNF